MTLAGLAALLRSWQPQLRREFLHAVAAAGERVSDVALLDAIRRQNVPRIVQLLEDAAVDLTAVRQLIGRSYLAGAEEGLLELHYTTANEVLGALQRTNPLAQQAAAFAGQRIVDVSQETKHQVQRLIVGAFDQGMPPRETAKLLRGVVGLSPRDVGALENFRSSLEDDGLAPLDVAARAERYAQTLLNRRALTIARTEIMDASVSGQQALWDHAVSANLLSARLEKVWIIGGNPCPDCEDLADTHVPIGGTFDGPDGPIQGPPAHPNCVCSVGLARERA